MNITKLTEKYIDKHPYIKESLKKGLINYSALSRKICKELKIQSFDATLIACRRYFWKIKDDIQEKEIMKLVKSAKLRVRSKIIVAILEKPRVMDMIYQFQRKVKKQKGDFNLIESEDVITIITNSNHLSELKEIFKLRLIKINKHLVQINMIFHEKIETTPGIVAYIYGLLAEKGINIVEEMSCWTDIMIVIDKKDMVQAINVLSF